MIPNYDACQKQNIEEHNKELWWIRPKSYLVQGDAKKKSPRTTAAFHLYSPAIDTTVPPYVAFLPIQNWNYTCVLIVTDFQQFS